MAKTLAWAFCDALKGQPVWEASVSSSWVAAGVAFKGMLRSSITVCGGGDLRTGAGEGISS